jgi:hypothetical protein
VKCEIPKPIRSYHVVDIEPDPPKPSGNCKGKKKNKFIKWLENKGFEFDDEHGDTVSYWNKRIYTAVEMWSSGEVFVEYQESYESEYVYKTVKEAKTLIKEIIGFYA